MYIVFLVLVFAGRPVKTRCSSRLKSIRLLIIISKIQFMFKIEFFKFSGSQTLIFNLYNFYRTFRIKVRVKRLWYTNRFQ
jgi:hypothetical protein